MNDFVGSNTENSRDDWIRTSDHTPPRRVRYRAALRPEWMAKIGESA